MTEDPTIAERRKQNQKKWRDRLRRFHELTGIPQYELANVAGITDSTLSQMLRGRRRITQAVAESASLLWHEWEERTAAISPTMDPGDWDPVDQDRKKEENDNG